MASKRAPMSKSHQKKPSTDIITGPKLPFETWRIILLEVFEAKTDISHPPGAIYEISPLQARLNIFRSLITCKYWYQLARDVFFEELQAETLHSLDGISKTITNHRHLARCVSQISMSFPVFRDTASTPSRPLKPRPLTNEENKDPQNGVKYNTLYRNYHNYRPSETFQGQQWTKWHGLCSSVLSRCTSLSRVAITFTSNFHAQSRTGRSGRGDYRRLFAPPNLDNKAILSGLQASTNLRYLQLTDPTPLVNYGPSLKSWKRLKECSIAFTAWFAEIDELSNTAFCPPKNLESFRFLDSAQIAHEWPLAAELTTCTDLKSLELGMERQLQEGTQTSMAIGFLLQSYQNTLTTLILSCGEYHQSFVNLFENLAANDQMLHFPHLSTLLLPGTDCSLSSFLRTFDAEEMEIFGIHRVLDDLSRIDEHEEENYWKTVLSRRSLSRLHRLRTNINHLSPAFVDVCHSMGIEIERWEM